jgi:hypothetical protein
MTKQYKRRFVEDDTALNVKEEFNLSGKIYKSKEREDLDIIFVNQVKEFIRLLKEELDKVLAEKREKNKTGYYDVQNFQRLAGMYRTIKLKINKLAGDKLK